MNKVDRSLVAIRIGLNSAFISWKLFIGEGETVSFNVYKVMGNATPVRINKYPLRGLNNYQDDNVDFSLTTIYYVVAIFSTKEKMMSKTYRLNANSPIKSIFSTPPKHRSVNNIPIRIAE